MKPELFIRSQTAADAVDYRGLMLEAYELAADAYTSTAAERATQPLRYWADRIASETGLSQCFGAWDGQENIQGTLALEYSAKPKTQHLALLIGMYVRPAWRRTGAARALLNEAILAARQRSGVRALQLTVTEGNTAAIGLYASAGFVAWGVQPAAILTPHGYRGKVHMQLPLTGDEDLISKKIERLPR